MLTSYNILWLFQILIWVPNVEQLEELARFSIETVSKHALLQLWALYYWNLRHSINFEVLQYFRRKYRVGCKTRKGFKIFHTCQYEVLRAWLSQFGHLVILLSLYKLLECVLLDSRPHHFTILLFKTSVPLLNHRVFGFKLVAYRLGISLEIKARRAIHLLLWVLGLHLSLLVKGLGSWLS